MKIDRVRGHSFVSDTINSKSLIVDLGMNEGHFSSTMQSKYHCDILGVEANPVLAQKLVKQNVKCLNAAISNLSGQISFLVDPDNSEASSLTLTQRSGVQSVKIPAITLADLLAKYDIQEIDLLKIDIEGEEVSLLTQVDTQVLQRIKQICVEFHIFLYSNHKPLVDDIISRMRSVGFYAVDFSRNFEDVLFINSRLIPLSTLDRLSIAAQKYGSGIDRMIRRKISA